MHSSQLSYRTKLVLGVGGLVLLTGASIIWLAQRSARSGTEALVHRLFQEVSSHAVTQTRGFLGRATPLAESLPRLASVNLAVDDTDELAKQLLPLLEAHPGISWLSYGDEAGTFTGVYRAEQGQLRINQSRIVDGRTRLIEHAVLPHGEWRADREEADNGYDPRQRPYYLKAKGARRPVWLPPYVFFDQGVPGISCAAPLYDADETLLGVFSIDFDLNALSAFVAQLKVSKNSAVFLFTDDAVLLAHPTERVISRTGSRGEGSLLTLDDVNDRRLQSFRGQLPQNPQTPLDSGFSFFRFASGEDEFLGSVTTFQVADDLAWRVGVIAPERDFLADVWRNQAISVILAIAALLGAVMLAVLMARSVSGPVLTLTAFMRKVGAGDLEARADLHGSREFHELSQALNGMIVDLRDRLRLRHSLDVAMRVQQQLLPTHAPRVEGLDVAGHSTYCDETGGDYYDFLVVEEESPDSMLIALGDVMGHGIAAALVMAGARAILRDRVSSAGSLSEILSRLNQLLASDFEGSRFMTMHVSLVNRKERTFRWASAGHDPAIIYNRATDSFEEIEGGDLPLGVMPDAEFSEHTFSPLSAGHVLIVGTDGVWEMPNAAGEQFGKDRLREVIRSAAQQPASVIVQSIVDRLHAFRGDTRQVDDVTFVVVKIV